MSEVNVVHAHTERYRQMLEDIARDGVCPFCVDFCRGNPPKYHPHPKIIETECWVVTKNVQPIEGSVYHLLLVAKDHVTNPWSLQKDAWADLQEVLAELHAKHGINHGALLHRFGDTNSTGGSVTHLHAQLIVGVSRKENTEPLLVYCGYKKMR
ncbi:MAG: hypothetical protein AAB355_02175 [Patescibacteria group bacterium]